MKNKKSIQIVLCALLALSGITAHAVPIAIIDSGTDYKHKMLAEKIWTNPGTTEGYTDDKHGWNFAENNNEIIDYKYLGTFSPDVKKYFEIQLKTLQGTATDEEKKWVAEKRQDKQFIQELMKFGNFVHGTHVAGIASKNAPQAQLMAAKIIPTEVKMPGQAIDDLLRTKLHLPRSLLEFPSDESKVIIAGPFDDLLMKGMLGMVAGRQTELLTTVGKYVNATKMKVANCSFGISMAQARMIAGQIGQMILKRELTKEETENYANYLVSQILEKGASFVQSAPETLFVMAAGNDGTNNDELGVFPANLKYENTITVAATREYARLASFSNYGEKNVEIAAPGVGIMSAIPGDDTMPLSGTSQAAPFVAHLVGKIMDQNAKLTFAQVKQILMDTVDKKDFLAGKVTSGGIANEERALHAAVLAASMDIGQAISQSRNEVADIKSDPSILGATDDGDPIPLPSLFLVN